MPKKNKNHDKSIAKEDFGNMLHKFINPLYEKVDKLDGKVDKLEDDVEGLRDDVEDVKGIQLRMENRLIDDNKRLR